MKAPEPGTALKALSDVPNPGGAPADYADLPILIVRSGEMLRAYINICPHQARPLCLPSGKTLISEDKFIVCPFHAASFEIETGKAAGGPVGKAVLKAIAVTVEGDQVVAA